MTRGEKGGDCMVFAWRGRFRWLGLAVFVVLLFALTRCGDNQKGPAARSFRMGHDGTFTDIYANTLSTACIGCHVPGQPVYDVNQVKLDFTTQANAFQTLTTSKVTGTSTNGKCASVSIVQPGAPKSSYLATVLFANYFVQTDFVVPGCDPYPVHQSDQNLTAGEESSIILWIQNGAPNN